MEILYANQEGRIGETMLAERVIGGEGGAGGRLSGRKESGRIQAAFRQKSP